MLKLTFQLLISCALFELFYSQIVTTLAGVEVKYTFSSSSTSFTLTAPLEENNLKQGNAWLGLGFNSLDVMVGWLKILNYLLTIFFIHMKIY